MGGRAKNDDTGFGGRLKGLREAAGLSQQALADRAGLNVFGVAKLEQGQREPAWSTVLALAAALGVTCEAFGPPPGDKPGPRAPAGPARPAAKPRKPKGKA